MLFVSYYLLDVTFSFCVYSVITEIYNDTSIFFQNHNDINNELPTITLNNESMEYPLNFVGWPTVCVYVWKKIKFLGTKVVNTFHLDYINLRFLKIVSVEGWSQTQLMCVTTKDAFVFPESSSNIYVHTNPVVSMEVRGNQKLWKRILTKTKDLRVRMKKTIFIKTKIIIMYFIHSFIRVLFHTTQRLSLLNRTVYINKDSKSSVNS